MEENTKLMVIWFTFPFMIIVAATIANLIIKAVTRIRGKLKAKKRLETLVR